jgi:hypothetical protein
MIQEASSSEIRVQRITAVVAACKKVSEERKGE